MEWGEKSEKNSSLNTSNNFKYSILHSKSKNEEKKSLTSIEMTYQIRITSFFSILYLLNRIYPKHKVFSH